MGAFRIKNWSRFQHYRDRNPRWIKLHGEILSSVDWIKLHQAQDRLLMIICMLIAARNSDGLVPDDPEYVRGLAYLHVVPNFKPLIDCGFLIPVADASAMQADASIDPNKANGTDVQADASNTLASARPEKEREGEREGEKNILIKQRQKITNENFETFWRSCPKKVGKLKARHAYDKALKATAPETLVTAMRRYAASRAGQDEAYTLHPSTWLNQGRWMDESGPHKSFGGLSEEEQQAERDNLKRMGVI